jgi:hypothetical protein
MIIGAYLGRPSQLYLANASPLYVLWKPLSFANSSVPSGSHKNPPTNSTEAVQTLRRAKREFRLRALQATLYLGDFFSRWMLEWELDSVVSHRSFRAPNGKGP